mmetsp:Transcript_100602/g.285071  ORF Transcript_100602/g.285071 Transcript_100602/m.285071 type:complete len:235 (-) Transcript_100602:112-816(-)
MATLNEVTKLWSCRKTIVEMLHDRGYDVEEGKLQAHALLKQEMTFEDFEGEWNTLQSDGDYRKQLFILATKRRPAEPEPPQQAGAPDQQIIVIFGSQKTGRCGPKWIRECTEECVKKFKIKNAILVVRVPLFTSAKVAIAEAAGGDVRIEVFHEDELIVNITHHDDVPTHMPLNEEGKQALLEKYNLKKDGSQLPQIKRDDPVARYFGMQRDQVMKIIRDSETAGKYVTYRRVI